MTKSVSSSVEFATSPCTRAAQRVSRKYNSTYRRKLQRREYKNLKKVLPALSTEPKVSKTDVIEEAIKYIDYLHAEIANRFYSGGVFKSTKAQSPVADAVKRLALQQQKTPHPQLIHQQLFMQQQQQAHPVFQFSPSFIQAGSELAGPQFLQYQKSLKSGQTKQFVSTNSSRDMQQHQQLYSSKTIKLRL